MMVVNLPDTVPGPLLPRHNRQVCGNLRDKNSHDIPQIWSGSCRLPSASFERFLRHAGGAGSERPARAEGNNGDLSAEVAGDYLDVTVLGANSSIDPAYLRIPRSFVPAEFNLPPQGGRLEAPTVNLQVRRNDAACQAMESCMAVFALQDTNDEIFIPISKGLPGAIERIVETTTPLDIYIFGLQVVEINPPSLRFEIRATNALQPKEYVTMYHPQWIHDPRPPPTYMTCLGTSIMSHLCSMRFEAADGIYITGEVPVADLPTWWRFPVAYTNFISDLSIGDP